MNSIRISKTSSYFPSRIITNESLEKQLKLEEGYIEKRTGIKERRYINNEKIEEVAFKSVKNMNITEKEKQKIGIIIVATTSTNSLIPGIANYIQKQLKIKPCICLDILAGCSGFINALDIAKLYIQTEKVEKALVIGVDILSNHTDTQDVSTAILLADGAGAILIEKSEEEKIYISNIVSDEKNNEILTCKVNENIRMDGKEIYKYAVTIPVENVKQLINKAEEDICNIKYFVIHQSNKKIMKSIASRLEIDINNVYMNIEKIGNTFCASIPIVLDEMFKKNLIKQGDKIVLLGYGGGMNTGSILMEI